MIDQNENSHLKDDGQSDTQADEISTKPKITWKAILALVFVSLSLVGSIGGVATNAKQSSVDYKQRSDSPQFQIAYTMSMFGYTETITVHDPFKYGPTTTKESWEDYCKNLDNEDNKNKDYQPNVCDGVYAAQVTGVITTVLSFASVALFMLRLFRHSKFFKWTPIVALIVLGLQVVLGFVCVGAMNVSLSNATPTKFYIEWGNGQSSTIDINSDLGYGHSSHGSSIEASPFLMGFGQTFGLCGFVVALVECCKP